MGTDAFLSARGYIVIVEVTYLLRIILVVVHGWVEGVSDELALHGGQYLSRLEVNSQKLEKEVRVHLPPLSSRLGRRSLRCWCSGL